MFHAARYSSYHLTIFHVAFQPDGFRLLWPQNPKFDKRTIKQGKTTVLVDPGSLSLEYPYSLHPVEHSTTQGYTGLGEAKGRIQEKKGKRKSKVHVQRSEVSNIGGALALGLLVCLPALPCPVRQAGRPYLVSRFVIIIILILHHDPALCCFATLDLVFASPYSFVYASRFDTEFGVRPSQPQHHHHHPENLKVTRWRGGSLLVARISVAM